MALSLTAALSFTSSQVILTNSTGSTDSTEYGVGGNPAFNELAHYAIIRKKNVNEVADEVLSLDSYNPLTATSFTVTRTADGWYEGILLDILIWTAGSYAADDVVYYSGSIYKANTTTTDTPGASADWDVVTDLTTLEDNASVYTVTDGRTTAYNADVYWSKQIAQNSQRGRCGICEDDRQKERLDKIELHLNAVLVADQQGNNDDAAWNVLSLIDLGAV